MDHLFPLLLYFACTLLPSLTRLAASFDNISTAATVAVAKLDLQYGVAHSSHVVLVTCVKNLYIIIIFDTVLRQKKYFKHER